MAPRRRQIRSVLAASLFLPPVAIAAVSQAPSVDELLPLQSRQRTFVITDGENEGQRLPLVLERAQRAGEWRLSIQGLNTLYLKRGPADRILLSRIDIPDANKAIVYYDPLPLLPADATAAESEDQSPVDVFNLETGKKTASGTARQHIDRVRETTFHLPVGPTSGYLVEARQTVDLGDTTVRLNVDSGFVPGQGMVYRRLNYKIDAPLMFGSSSSRTVELAEQ